MNPFERIQQTFGALGGGGLSPQQQQMGAMGMPAAQMASQAPQTGMFAKFNNGLQDNRSAMMAAAAGMMGSPGNPGSIGQGMQNYMAGGQMDEQRREKETNQNATHAYLKKQGYGDEDIAFFKANPQAMVEALKPKTGGDAFKLFGQEQDLRKEYSGRGEVKSFKDVESAYKTVRAAAQMNSGAGDISLVFGFMKMIDPGSTVREGEFATAENTAGVPTRVMNAYNKALKGTFLDEAQRMDFVNAADGMYQARAQTVQGVQEEYGGIADQWGIDSSRVYQPPTEFEPLQIGATAKVPNGGSVKRIR